MKKANLNKNHGYSLMEVMIAIGVFALLAVLVTQALVVSLKSVRKSDAQNRVRANLDSAVSVMERQLRNANSIDTCTGGLGITYRDTKNNLTSFTCNLSNHYIASGSARLTSTDVNITTCSITCTQTSGIPDSVDISLTGIDSKTTGGESSSVSVQTKVMLRNY